MKNAGSDDTPPPSAFGDHVERLDLRMIADLRSIPGETEPELLNEVINLFVEQTPDLLAQLRASHAAGDAVATLRMAHAIKGTAGNMGAVRMQLLCEWIEFHAKNGDLAAIPPFLNLLEEEYPQAKTALLSERDNPSPAPSN